MGKNTLEKARANELLILHILAIQGWIREFELSLLAGMSVEMVTHTCRRLEKLNQVSRCQIDHGAGFYVRLLKPGADRVDAKSGKDIQLPKSWRHDAIAIQVLIHLKQMLSTEAHVYTEALLRKRGMNGKMPDGILVAKEARYFLEQEFTRKNGPYLRAQIRATLEIVSSLKDGIVIAYPYPPQYTPMKFDHEKSMLGALRESIEQEYDYQSDRKKLAGRIWFCRVLFDSHLNRENARPSGFEVLRFSDLCSFQ